MKFLVQTFSYGDRVAGRFPGGTHAFFFEGKAPGIEAIIVLDLPELRGFDEFNDTAVIQWFQKRLGVKGPRELMEIPESYWQLAVLDDFLEAENYRWLVWQAGKQFGMADFQQFATRHLPLVQVHMTAVLGITDERQRLDRLGEIQPFMERVFAVLTQAPNRIQNEYAEGIRVIEEAHIRSLSTFSIPLWVKTADSFYTSELALRLLIEVVNHLKQTAASQEQIHDFLAQINAHKKLRNVTEYAPQFWVPLQRIMQFEGNVSGETIDVAPAREQTVYGNWQLYEARRVGRITPDRGALVMREANGTVTYIGADRKLKFEIYRAGGSLERLGNTLIIGDSDQARLQQALVVVEELNALANVDPAEALGRVAHLNLPPEHPVFEAAAKAEDDYRYGRILADLLIELVVGIDADVAQRLIRGQSRKVRR